MAINFSKLSVLLVDDNVPVRDILSAVIERLGVKTIYKAENGVSGFITFRNSTPDIVIADWEMPEQNGLNLTREIRRNPLSPNRMAPIIMLTGYSAPERVTMARDIGATEFLVKPFTATSLIQRISHVINKPRDFIDHPHFFGPDRRRKKENNYKGPFKRKSDKIIFT